MKKSNSIWRHTALPVQAIGLGLFAALSAWFVAGAATTLIGLFLGSPAAMAFYAVFGAPPLATAAFGYGAIASTWTAKDVGGARPTAVAMLLLLVLALAVIANEFLSRGLGHPGSSALASVAPLLGGALYLASVGVGKSRATPAADGQNDA